MKSRKKIIELTLILLLALITQNTVHSQTIVDTLYRHPDTTTFYDETITIVGDITNLAVKYKADEEWSNFYIDKILFVQPTGVDQGGFCYLFFSHGELPEDSIFAERQIFGNNPVFPYYTEVELDPPVYIQGYNEFFLSGSLFYFISRSDYFDYTINDQYAFWFTLQKWIEYVPVYFNIGIVVRNDISSINVNHHSPENFKIYQNYPNPFNPVTTIQFYSVDAGESEIFIYDILGSIKKTYTSNITTSGLNEFIINADNLSSGVYFYRIKINSQYSSVMKMIVLK